MDFKFGSCFAVILTQRIFIIFISNHNWTFCGNCFSFVSSRYCGALIWLMTSQLEYSIDFIWSNRSNRLNGQFEPKNPTKRNVDNWRHYYFFFSQRTKAAQKTRHWTQHVIQAKHPLTKMTVSWKKKLAKIRFHSAVHWAEKKREQKKSWQGNDEGGTAEYSKKDPEQREITLWRRKIWKIGWVKLFIRMQKLKAI